MIRQPTLRTPVLAAKRDDGPPVVEYNLMVALIAAVIITAAALIGTHPDALVDGGVAELCGA